MYNLKVITEDYIKQNLNITNIRDTRYINKLSLNNKYIYKINNNAFSILGNLKYLYLEHNNISKLETNTFEGLGNLSKLVLSFNSIGNIENKAFHSLDNLKELYLADNIIKNLENNTLKGLIKLIYLDLNSNQIVSIEKNSFNDLINLNTLLLSINKLKKITNDMFNGLSKLISLDLDLNKLTTIEFNSFSDLINIQSLFIESNTMSKLDLNIFKNNKKLIKLYASHNNVMSLVGDMSCISSLKELYLNNNTIVYIKVSGLFEYLLANNSIYLNNNRRDLIFNCSFKWILENFKKRSFNFISGNSNITWIIVNGLYHTTNLKMNTFKSYCLFNYFNNQESCRKEQIIFDNYLLDCNKGNPLYMECYSYHLFNVNRNNTL